MSYQLDFTDDLHHSMLQARGSSMIHEIGILCTCRNGDPFSALSKDGRMTQRPANCNKCAGEFWLYRDPQLMAGFAVSMRQTTSISGEGVFESGDMMFSTGMPVEDGKSRSPRKLALWDKLTATWSQPVDGGQVIVRAAGSKGLGAQFTSLEEDEDKLWYEPHSAIWCEDENEFVYTEDKDFILGPGRLIKWVGNKPLDGVKFTIKYNAYFEWIVFQNPQERIDRNGKDIGQSVSIRKKHVVMINDSPSANTDAKLSLQSRVKC